MPIKEKRAIQKKMQRINKFIDLLGIKFSDEDKKIIKDAVNICRIKNLNIDIRDHAATYVMYATQVELLRQQVNDIEDEIAKLEQTTEDSFSYFIILFRECVDEKTRVTEALKEEFKASVRAGNFLDTPFYESFDSWSDEFREKSETLNKEIFNNFSAIDKLNKSLRESKNNIGVIEQIVNALGYQKKEMLKSLTSLVVQGVSQEF